ncbi:hypothetical protein PHYPSEUDO_011967 [Phytophthora pseudosyringae]|uniref:Protein kinase domain-containing protein n=1 Tax=Phytophthora pseudosyringae TaxID=221518 RepID=A0A8T1V7I6_9STRA|nr:hypothetical protein PHYPSEUDO_011967 [Phytophthora pseudosyringae]
MSRQREFGTDKSPSDDEMTATIATNQLSRMFKKRECDTNLSDTIDQLSASIAMSALTTRESHPVWKSYYGSWRGSRVAVRKAKVKNDEDASAFLNEVDIWYNLRHPHVLLLFGACYIVQSFFVCEDVEYGSLDRYLRHHREKVWEKLHEIALGLQYLHDKGVVYGLLKCCTILVGKDGRAKLSDFRKSPLIRSTSWQTDVGSIGWTAPELLRGEKATNASDIYSFGMCILEAVSGKGLWLSRAGFDMPDAAIRFQVLRRKMLPVRPSSCPADVYELVQQMCRFNSGERVGMEQVVAVVKEFTSRTSPEASCIVSEHEAKLRSDFDELNIVSGGSLYYGNWHGSRVIVKVMEPESEGSSSVFVKGSTYM